MPALLLRTLSPTSSREGEGPASVPKDIAASTRVLLANVLSVFQSCARVLLANVLPVFQRCARVLLANVQLVFQKCSGEC